MNQIKCSIIIPTKDREKILEGTLKELAKCSGIEFTEFIICNDGSSDATTKVIELFSESNPQIKVTIFEDGHKGVAFQRNRAAAAALGQVLIFAADDIRPHSKTWILDHLELHFMQPSNDFAVLGKITWPSSQVLTTNAVMATVQGRGGEQFGYSDLMANSFLDWRFFYTSNLSIKKSLVNDWISEGFSLEFQELGFEDIEFSYRLFQQNKLRIFYSNVTTALHFQDMKVLNFCERQRAAGAMAVKFVELHPELENLLTPRTHHVGDPKNISVIMRLIDGLQAYVEWLEITGYLGTEDWHRDLLHSLFKIYYRLGIIDKMPMDDSNLMGNELEGLLRTTLLELGHKIGFTVLGRLVSFDPTQRMTVGSSMQRTRFKVGFLTISISQKNIHRILSNKFLLSIALKLRSWHVIKKI